ncbi:trimeric intracellular cation channel family protein [Bacillus thermotolerans]|uniref:Membrane protein n=1 Tax=Bacillus thermotolerans TaxID=1221996 RepID=A0A0F5HQS4_BACTR|nr:trimeric intracellular cation channel family protein [Bacillus thermotolerans]KKB33258.1 membrane protein [Bacillus thermotolerans]KKB35598.1 putative membrane protein [Bacillus thermotolerans]
MVWDVLNVIGTIAFVMSGAVVALEVKYDIIGAYVLGLITAFGGGAVRNLFIGIPIIELWQQTALFIVAIITITIVILLPSSAVHFLTKWSIFDSIGLSAFAVQGAMYAQSIDLPLLAVMFSAAITGAGGGIIRDVLAQKKPIVLRQDVYLLWAIFAGFIIGMEWVSEAYQYYILFAVTLMLRGISHRLGWSLPTRTIQQSQKD